MTHIINDDKSWRLVCLIRSYGTSESERQLSAARVLLRSLATLRGLECVCEEHVRISSRLPEDDVLSDLYTRTDVFHLRPLPHSKETEKSIRYLLRLAFRNCNYYAPLVFGILSPELLDRFPVNGKMLLS